MIGFGDKTPMASPDHWQAMQITDAAVFYSRLTKWDEIFVADISDTLETKLNAVRCYEMQFPPAKEHVFERIRGAALAAGSAAGFPAGENFASVRPLGTPDLMKCCSRRDAPRGRVFIERNLSLHIRASIRTSIGRQRLTIAAQNPEFPLRQCPR